MGSGRGWPTTRSTRSIWCRGHPGRTCGSRANKPWTSRVGNVLPFARSSSVLTPTLLACYAMSGVIHLASISLNTLLPFHVVALGGSRTQVGLLASSLAIAVAPPMAFGLRGLGGMPLAFAAVTVFAVVLFALALSIPVSVTAPAPGAQSGFRPISRHAVSVSCALALTTIGHSSIYAFLPLYAISRGHGAAVVWFFTAYSIWLIVWRALLGGLSDRIGRARVALPAMALTALAYFTLALPPTPASLMIAALLLGAGSAVLYPTLAALVVDRAPEGERGLALGTLSGAWDLGVVVGSALIGFVADRVSFGSGFAIAGVTTMLGALAFFVTERHPTRRASVV